MFSDSPSIFKKSGQLLVSVSNPDFLLPIVINSVMVILLNSLTFVHLLETLGYRLVVHDLKEIGKEVRY